MGGGDDTHVDVDRLDASQTLELLFLNGTQQLWLQFQADVADLVEKERTPIGELESALLLQQGSREGPSLVPEQLALEQSRGIAAQLIRTNGRSRLALRLCIARAISSFPVPVSPCTSTVASVGATVATCSSTLCSASLLPTMSLKWRSERISDWRYSRSSSSEVRHCRMAFSSSSSSKGFVKKVAAPALRARTVMGISPDR